MNNLIEPNKIKHNQSFTATQWQFISARLISKSDAEAARRIGIKPQSAAAWGEKQAINDWLAEARENHAAGVIASLDAHALQASARLAELMQSRDEAIALRASMAIIEHTIGKARQRVTTANDGPVEYVVRLPDNGSWRDKLIEALKDGRIEPKAISERLGDDIAAELFQAAGIRSDSPVTIYIPDNSR
jgi:hypothetical protein